MSNNIVQAGNDSIADGSDHDQEVSQDAEAFAITSEEPVPLRPTSHNRKWLNYTNTERDLAESLEQIESDGLAIHLYNAHHIKRRLYDDQSEGRRVKPHFRKDRWRAQEHEKTWTPRRDWTAWPLEPERIPRADERARRLFDTDGRSLVGGAPSKPVQKPIAELEDCLLSEILKQAREDFTTRQSTARDEVVVDDEAMKHEAGTSRPAIMADEERAHQISKPVIRHVAAQLEDLLRALHTSRTNHIRHEAPDIDDERTSGPESSRTRSRSISRRPRGHRKRHAPLPRDWSEVLGVAAMIGWDSAAVERAISRCSQLLGESMDLSTLPENSAERQQPLSRSASCSRVGHSTTSSRQPSRERLIEDLCCPYLDCWRHQKPYPFKWRLNEHLRRHHDDRSTSRPRAGDQPEEDMYGGVHVDGFMKTIKLPPRPRSRPRRTRVKIRPRSNSQDESEDGASDSGVSTDEDDRSSSHTTGNEDSSSDSDSPSEDQASSEGTDEADQERFQRPKPASRSSIFEESHAGKEHESDAPQASQEVMSIGSD